MYLQLQSLLRITTAPFPLLSHAARHSLRLLGLLHEKREKNKSCYMKKTAKKKMVFHIVFCLLTIVAASF
jgi:hypothetical protein